LDCFTVKNIVMSSVTNTSNIPTPLPFSTGLSDDMLLYVSQFLGIDDQESMSNTNVSTNALLGDMNDAIEKRRAIEKDAIETLLKSNIDACLVDGGSFPPRAFRIDMLTAYLNQFGIYDESIIDENGVFKNDPIYTSENLDLLKHAITLVPEKAFAVGMKMVTADKNEPEVEPEDEDYDTRYDYMYHELINSHGYRVIIVAENMPGRTFMFIGFPNVLILGPNVTRILDREYWDNESLETVIMTDSVTSIGHAAFANCENLVNVHMSSSIDSIRSSAFQGCQNLVSIKIPELVTKIESNTFTGCRKLVSISIPTSVTSIEAHAFSGCRGLVDVGIPDSVTTLKTSIFNDCWSLEKIRLPSSITRIDTSMFLNCKSLRTVLMSSSVRVIQSFAFYGCDSLESITCYDSDEEGWCAYVPKSVRSVGSKAFMMCPLESEVKKCDVPYY
jgi:hypothetical protein